MKKASTVWRHARAENDDQNRSGMQNGWIMKDARNTTRPGYKRNARQQCSTNFKSNDTMMPRLNADSRQRALGNLEAGMDARQVARAFGVHVSTIYRLTDRFLQNNNVVDRPRVTSQRQDRNIVRTHMRDRFLPATTTARQTVGTTTCPFPTPRYDVVWSPSIWTVVDRTLDNVSQSDTALHDTTGLFCIDSGGTDSGRTSSSPTKAATA